MAPPRREAPGPGFPLQVLGIANAIPVGFPLQSLARAPAGLSRFAHQHALTKKFTAKSKKLNRAALETSVSKAATGTVSI
jgi:hypothetical protein